MSKTFWVQVLERAGKAFAASLVASLGAGAVNVLSVPWTAALSVAVGAAVVSVLINIASLSIGPADSPSLVQTDPRR